MYCSRKSEPTYTYRKNGKEYTNKQSDFYNCSTYSLGKAKFREQCSGHFIRSVVLRDLVLDMIKRTCSYVREHKQEFIHQIREDATLQRGETAKSYKKLIAKNERRIAELENLFRRTYEDNIAGRLNDKRFQQMTADYEREQAELETKNVQMQAELDEYNSDNDRVNGFIALVKKYTEFEELTNAMLNEFISRIVVYKADKNEWGERTQKVDIYFNFIGKFDAPFIEPELSPEEAEVLEKRRLKLQKQREANKRFRAKQKQNTA